MKSFEIMKALNGYLVFEDGSTDPSRQYNSYKTPSVFETLDGALAFIKRQYEPEVKPIE